MSAAAQRLFGERDCDWLDELEQVAERAEELPRRAREATHAVIESFLDEPATSASQAARARALLARIAPVRSAEGLPPAWRAPTIRRQ